MHLALAVGPLEETKETLWKTYMALMCAQVNVIHGCNEKCTYCVVPNTRGVEQSRAPEAIKVRPSDYETAQKSNLQGRAISLWQNGNVLLCEEAAAPIRATMQS